MALNRSPILRSAERRQIPWVNALAKGLRVDDVNNAIKLMALARQRLEVEINGTAAIDET
jgi:hypothetical protein